MTITTVNSTADLLKALKTASAGDTIALASGSYDKVNIRGIAIDGNVTIRSADSGHPAILNDLIVRESKGLTFEGLEFNVHPDKGIQQFLVRESDQIILTKLDVHGTLNGSAKDDASGIAIRNSTNVTVSSSEFHELWHGIGFADSEHVTISGNSFHDIRTDGVRGGGVSHLTITGNKFTDFTPIENDHPDAIQIWTTNTETTAHDILITDNVVTRGNGAPIQGIFLRDTFSNLPFERVTITGNELVGTGYNGIAIDGVNGLVIAHNDVVSIEGQKSWIRAINTTDGHIEYNSAVQVLPSAGVVAANNSVSAYITADDALRATQDGFSQVTAVVKGALALAASKATVPVLDTAAATAAKSVAIVGSGSVITGTGADERLKGTNGDDSISAGNGADLVQGLKGNDWIEGGAGNDDLRGDEGDDSLFGGHGEDKLYGGIGNDLLDGGDGADWLEGGLGADTLTGGLGADKFVFRPADFDGDALTAFDVITDFDRSEGDRISLSLIDANTKTATDDPFRFIGTAAFSKVAGELRYDVVGSDAYVSGDWNGDGVADFKIMVRDQQSLIAQDFVL